MKKCKDKHSNSISINTWLQCTFQIIIEPPKLTTSTLRENSGRGYIKNVWDSTSNILTCRLVNWRKVRGNLIIKLIWLGKAIKRYMIMFIRIVIICFGWWKKPFWPRRNSGKKLSKILLIRTFWLIKRWLGVEKEVPWRKKSCPIKLLRCYCFQKNPHKNSLW